MAEEVENNENEESTENLKVLENIDVMLTVEVGRTEITIRDLLRLNEGSVVELDRLAGDPLDIMVNNTKNSQRRGCNGRRTVWCSIWGNCGPRKKNGKYLIV